MLNQTDEDTMLFLELFTRELILNSRTKESPEQIKEKTLKKKIQKEIKITPLVASEFNIQEEIVPENLTVYKKPVEYRIKEVNLPKIVPPKEFKEIAQPKVARPNKTRRIIPTGGITQSQYPPPKIKRAPLKVQIKRNFTTPIKTQAPHIPSATVGPAPGMEVDLGKLNMLATDKWVTVIECQGPEKFVLVKKTGKVNLTQIKLSQEEINNIISAFSEKARIPVMDGVFKAIVGDISINAIITNSICSRFMIYKKSLYSFLEQ